MKKTNVKPSPRRGGRPSRADAGKLNDKILDVATAMIFAEGYGAVSIEKIAARARISKRTFYARYDNKAAIFSAAVHRIIQRLRPAEGTATDALFQGSDVEEVLRRLAPIILKASLSAESLALQRVVIGEAKRFPELVLILHHEGMRAEAIKRIAALLREDAKKNNAPLAKPDFLAEQFLQLVTSAPLRRAMGFGKPLTARELDSWAEDAVDLFLKGYRS